MINTVSGVTGMHARFLMAQRAGWRFGDSRALRAWLLTDALPPEVHRGIGSVIFALRH